jgi:hypothetical protein
MNRGVANSAAQAELRAACRLTERLSSAAVAPDELLTSEAFAALTQSEQDDYLKRVVTSFEQANDEGDYRRALEYLGHYRRLVHPEPLSSPEEYDRIVATPSWNLIWNQAEKIVDLYEDAIADPELTEAEKTELEPDLDEMRLIVAHKRDVAGTDETARPD